MVVVTACLMWERKPRGLKSTVEGVAAVAVVEEVEARGGVKSQEEA
jgi:hypothetical protein